MPKGMYVRSKYCKRGHLRTPDNVGLHRECKLCKRENSRTHYKANPEGYRASGRVWEKSNPEKNRARAYAWFKTNREKTIWNSMFARCTNPKCKEYKYYGALGVKVCRRWLKFENFLVWANARHLSIP